MPAQLGFDRLLAATQSHFAARVAAKAADTILFRGWLNQAMEDAAAQALEEQIPADAGLNAALLVLLIEDPSVLSDDAATDQDDRESLHVVVARTLRNRLVLRLAEVVEQAAAAQEARLTPDNILGALREVSQRFQWAADQHAHRDLIADARTTIRQALRTALSECNPKSFSLAIGPAIGYFQTSLPNRDRKKFAATPLPAAVLALHWALERPDSFAAAAARLSSGSIDAAFPG